MKITQVHRKFTQSQASRITGLSPALQREWRLRCASQDREERKWTRYAVADVIELRIMKMLADAGVSVSRIGQFAVYAVEPAMSHMLGLPGAMRLQASYMSTDLRDRILRSMLPAPCGRYVCMTRSADGRVVMRNGATWDMHEALLEEARSSFSFTVDCHRLAEEIFSLIDGEVLTIEVERDAAGAAG